MNSSSLEDEMLTTTTSNNSNNNNNGNNNNSNKNRNRRSNNDGDHNETNKNNDRNDRNNDQQRQLDNDSNNSKGKMDTPASSLEGQHHQEEEEEDANKKPSYIQIAKEAYKALVNAIIRPPRANYKTEHLGPTPFTFCGKQFARKDLTLTTMRGLKLVCSHWEPLPQFRPHNDMPAVIFTHGNASARVEALTLLSHLLRLGVTVFAFDFAGSGMSEGEYVSLGYYEREDLECVVEYLRMTNTVSAIAVWGRSMGAATALMYGCDDTALDALILDSSYADLPQLCREIVGKLKEQGINIPGVLVSLAIRILSSSVHKHAKFAIRDISPVANVHQCTAPAMFVAAIGDDFIPRHHSEQLCIKYGGESHVLLVEGDHNSQRPQMMFDEAANFLRRSLSLPESWALPIHPSTSLMYPPWYYPTAYNQPTKEPVDTGFNSEEMGMTQQRQQSIQDNVVKMFGQDEGQEVNAAAVMSTVASIAKDHGIAPDTAEATAG